jgi:hypothetical protein
MSRKRTKGNSYNHRINAGQYGKKRSRATFNMKVQDDFQQIPMRFSETVCDDCGKPRAYLRKDGKYRCTLCEMGWDS